MLLGDNVVVKQISEVCDVRREFSATQQHTYFIFVELYLDRVFISGEVKGVD
jgi:hypothetical protein